MRALYYPDVYVHSENWLKFALLYFDEIAPITPFRLQTKFPDWYKNAVESTDLIKPHHPTMDEGDFATTKALKRVDEILHHPEWYRPVFKDRDFLNQWRDVNAQTVLIYSSKYNHEWELYCIKNGIAHRTTRGVVVAKDVADIYMTILSQVISGNKGVAVVTDSPGMNKFSLFRGPASDKDNRILLAKSIIRLVLPTDFKHVAINTIIALRNREDYREHLRAFHRELHRFYFEVANDTAAREFISEYSEARRGLFSHIINITGNIIQVAMSALNISHGTVDIGTIAPGLASVGTTWGAVDAFTDYRRGTISQRHCSRYLATLKRISGREDYDMDRAGVPIM